MHAIAFVQGLCRQGKPLAHIPEIRKLRAFATRLVTRLVNKRAFKRCNPYRVTGV